MTTLQKLHHWLATYEGFAQLADLHVDYTDHLPDNAGVFPSGLVEIRRTEDVLGNITVENQYNFALYRLMGKSPGDDTAAMNNADGMMDFQLWVQAQSVTHQAPTFGNIAEEQETISAQNGSLYETNDEGTALYVVIISAKFKKYYPAKE